MRARSRWMLLGAFSLIVLGCIEALEARLRGSVDLPCVLQSRTHPIEDLLVYWQTKVNDTDVFVLGAKYGNLFTNNQSERYRERASLSLLRVRNGDFTLHLTDLLLMDNGTYFCYVFLITSSYMILQKNITELHITAEYTEPVITRAKPTEGSAEMTFTCTTEGGAPQPEIMWVNTSDGAPIHKDQIHNNINEDKDFINVTSTITINVTSSTNLSCIILTASGNLTSTIDMSEVIGGNTETEKRNEAAPTVWNYVIIVVLLLIFATLVVILVLRRRSCFSRGRPQHTEYHQGPAEIEMN